MKKKLLTLLLATFTFVSIGKSQKVLKEATFDPEGKAKITNLSEVQIDEDKNSMVLYYLTKSTERKVKAEILYFDLDFNYIKTENYEDDIEKVRQKFKLNWGWSWSSCGSDSKALLSVETTLMGQTVFKKGFIDRFYNWYTGYCDSKFRLLDKVKPKGEDGEKMKLYNYWTNNDIQEYVRSAATVNRFGYVVPVYYDNKHLMEAESGDVVICVAAYDRKQPKENGLHWVFEKYSVSTLEKVKSTKLEFPVAAQPIKSLILATGNVSYVFQRADKKYEYVEVTYDGTLVRRYTIDMPGENSWIVDEINEQDGVLYIHGLTNKTKVTPASISAASFSPLMSGSTLKGLAESPNGYQIMKVTPEKIDWVTFTSEKEFKPTFVQMGTEKGKPYAGGILHIGELQVGPTGNILITAQKYSSGGGIAIAGVSLASYQEVVAFNFDSHGKLIANYSTKLRAKNEYNKATPTEHALLNAPNGQGIYWTVFEVAGAKKLGETARMLYYPRIAKISNDGKTTTDFTDIGGGDYYLDDMYPVNILKDNKIIFIGSDKKGKTMWFSKVQFE